MKNILIATDFSKSAENALTYGWKLADHIGATCYVMHAYEIPAPGDRNPFLFEEDFKEIAEDKLDEIIRKLPEASRQKIKILALEGDAGATIIKQAKAMQDSLLVIGIGPKKMWGSTTQDLIKKCPIPLIAVPEDADFIAPDKIAFAADVDSNTDLDLLNPLVDLGLAFNASTYIVRALEGVVDELPDFRSAINRLNWQFKGLHPYLKTTTEEDVTAALCHFVEHHHIKLLAMLAHHRNIVSQLFTKDHIGEMLSKTKIPVMVLPAQVTDADKSHYALDGSNYSNPLK